MRPLDTRVVVEAAAAPVAAVTAAPVAAVVEAAILTPEAT